MRVPWKIERVDGYYYIILGKNDEIESPILCKKSMAIKWLNDIKPTYHMVWGDSSYGNGAGEYILRKNDD